VPWILFLNDMRFGQVEILQPICQAETPEALEAFLEAERSEPYVDEVGGYRWGKNYRRGGPLEWCNPPFDESNFQEVPFQVTLRGCVQYSNPVVILPTVETLREGFPPYSRLERVAQGED